MCSKPATDGRFSGYGPSMEWWHTIAGTLDEIQWVYQTDKNYWDKVVGPHARCGCGQGTPPCDPMKWSIRQIPAKVLSGHASDHASAETPGGDMVLTI